MRYIFLLSVCISGLFVASCNVINPTEVTPTYIYLDSTQFKVNDALKEGSGSQKVTSAWVYFNNDLVGAFELPTKVPILATAAGQVRITAGVTYSGLSQESQYPFFAGDTFNIQPAAGQVLHPIPTFTYVAAAKFPLKEDFETGNTFGKLNPNNTSDTTIVRTDDKSKVFEGGGSGYIFVDGTHPTSENVSNTAFAITQGESYLELNYKCNTSFQVGLITSINGQIVPQYLAGVKAKESWNKIYVALSKFTGNYPSKSYSLIIKTGLDDGLSTGYVLLDNIKVVSF
jgi:hypothetical protein